MNNNKKKRIPKLVITIIVIADLMLLVGLLLLGKYLIFDGNFQPQFREVIETDDTNADVYIEETTEEVIVKIYDVEEPESDANGEKMPTVNVPLDKAKQIIASDIESDIKKMSFLETNEEDYEGYINWVLTFSCAGKKYDYMVSAYDGRILRRNEIENSKK